MGCKLLLYEYNSCYRKDGEWMILKIDFESEEALYVQLCNQIIRGIATETLHEGDSLPSVRQLADEIGINMHTVNKAYSVLKPVSYTHLKQGNAVHLLPGKEIPHLEKALDRPG